MAPYVCFLITLGVTLGCGLPTNAVANAVVNAVDVLAGDGASRYYSARTSFTRNSRPTTVAERTLSSLLYLRTAA